MTLQEATEKVNNDPQLEQAWYDYRCDNPNTVGGYMEELPKFVKEYEANIQ